MERTLYPGVGTGQTTGLQFFARSVRINSGQNFVTIQPWGYVIPPNVIGNIYLLPTAVETALFDITAPPAGTAPVGPSQQTQTALTYFDYAQQPSPGTVGTPQTVVALDGAFAGAGLKTFDIGLARAFTAFMVSSGAAQTFTMILNDPEFTSGVVAFAGATVANFAAGHGTQQFVPTGTFLPTGTYTIHLSPTIEITSTAAAVWGARLYY